MRHKLLVSQSVITVGKTNLNYSTSYGLGTIGNWRSYLARVKLPSFSGFPPVPSVFTAVASRCTCMHETGSSGAHVQLKIGWSCVIY